MAKDSTTPYDELKVRLAAAKVDFEKSILPLNELSPDLRKLSISLALLIALKRSKNPKLLLKLLGMKANPHG